MREFCHRCHGELPQAGPGRNLSDDDVLLFCPRCSAPQLRLPEHMRSEYDAAASPELTTGALPPPRIMPRGASSAPSDPRGIDWRAALTAAGLVTAVAAGLRLLSLEFELLSILWFFWLLSGANLALSLYARKHPGGWMDARVGMRIGLVTGILMCAALAVVGGASGVVMRYGLHTMEKVDQQSDEQTRAMQARIEGWMQQQDVDPGERQNFVDTMNSPLMRSSEFRGGSALLSFGFAGFILVFISGGAGALNGMMRGSKLARRRGNS